MEKDKQGDVAAEAGLLANLVHLWEPVMRENQGNIASIYLCTENGLMLNYDERADLAPRYWDYTAFSWYILAKEAGDVIFTTPYMDTFGRGLMLTCAAPVYDGADRFAGVIALDMMVADLSKTVLDIDFGPGSYGFLVDQTGDIIVSPNMEYDGTFQKVSDACCPAHEAADSILSGQNGVTAVSNGIYYAYAPIAAADWTLVVHMPADIVTEPAETIRENIASRTSGTADTIDKSILQNELYGIRRLGEVLNRNAGAAPAALIPAVKADIDAFVGTSPQFDDITMLSLEFKKKMRLSNPDELTVAAVTENISRVTAFVEERLEAMDCPVKARALISVAVDELFGNIVHYAYDTVTGSATVRVGMEEAPAAACVTFMDHGKPYDPLAKPDPDISLSAEERPIGGLGIFMVKKPWTR